MSFAITIYPLIDWVLFKLLLVYHLMFPINLDCHKLQEEPAMCNSPVTVNAPISFNISNSVICTFADSGQLIN